MPTHPQRTWAVVVNWNRADATIRCVRALLSSRPAVPDIIVVDNGSTDGSMPILREAFPQIELVALPHNGGFAVGSNAGVRRARANGATHVWLVNNDAEAHPDALAALQAAADAPRVAAVGSVLVHANDDGTETRVCGGGVVNLWTGRSRHCGKGRADETVDYLVAASVLLRLSALNRDVPFDEAYFLYWEDVDLSFRLRAEGWRLAVADAALVTHGGHGSLAASDPRFDFHYHASAARFFRQHAPTPLVPIAMGTLRRGALRLLGGRWRNALAALRGTTAGLRAANMPLPRTYDAHSRHARP